MRPSELSKALRHIASRIEASKNPSKSLVASELKKVLRHIASPALPPGLKGLDNDNIYVVQVAPSSGGPYEHPSSGIVVQYVLNSVVSAGEKGGECDGSLTIDGNTFHIKMGSYKSHSTYEKLTCNNPKINVNDYDENLREEYSTDLGNILLWCVNDVIMKACKAENIPYKYGTPLFKDGPIMDWIIDNNYAFLAK